MSDKTMSASVDVKLRLGNQGWQFEVVNSEFVRVTIVDEDKRLSVGLNRAQLQCLASFIAFLAREV